MRLLPEVDEKMTDAPQQASDAERAPPSDTSVFLLLPEAFIHERRGGT
jgi:hypothetical protein